MENAPIQRADKLVLQAQWLNHRMADNPRWKRDAPAPRLLTLGDRKVFVAWRLTPDHRPEILDVLRVSDIVASFTSGLNVLFTGSATTSVIRISTYPRELVPGVFAWLPPFSEVRHVPSQFNNPGGVWDLTLPMFVRTEGGPAVEVGQTVFMTRKEFRARWPDINL